MFQPSYVICYILCLYSYITPLTRRLWAIGCQIRLLWRDLVKTCRSSRITNSFQRYNTFNSQFPKRLLTLKFYLGAFVLSATYSIISSQTCTQFNPNEPVITIKSSRHLRFKNVETAHLGSNEPYFICAAVVVLCCLMLS
jgi:hypothetical protein